MKLSNYIKSVLSNKKNIFCDIELDDNFDKSMLQSLCNNKFKRKKLIVAWSIIIDFLNDKLPNEIYEYLTDDILQFLIENNICLNDLGHLKLPEEYLKKIYEKDNSCWEALENINELHGCEDKKD